jgi:NADH dehydrogenase
MTDKNNEKHKIVIVGGGAAGLELATSLGKKLGRFIDAYLEAIVA